jgi:MFS family permease
MGWCAVSYPAMRDLLPILSVGTIEAISIVVIEPTIFAVISEGAPPEVRGRAMGIGGLFQFGGSGVGAGLLGAGYGLGEPVPFIAGGALCIAAALLCATMLPQRRAGPEPAAAPLTAAVDLEARA